MEYFRLCLSSRNVVQILYRLARVSKSIMSADQQICPICQQPKQAGKAGSLTQWISTCQCGLTAPEPDSESEASSPELCRRCGKRVSQGRSGSLTQWILRSDLCACDFPAIDEPGQSGAQALESEPVPSPEPEVYLELDEDILPTERYRPIELLGMGWLAPSICVAIPF